MAILGYCSGTLAISLEQGSADAFFGIIGGLLGGVFYTLLLPSIQEISGPNLGVVSLHTLAGKSPVLFYILLILSLLKREFKIQLIHDNWRNFKNNSRSSRIIWSLFGGFLLIFGARMAGGCTSGHVISGGMQLAVSSLVFAGLLITGRFFYGKENFNKKE